VGPDRDEVGSMGVGDRGYVFTLTTALMIMIVLSLAFFYTRISSPEYEDSSNRMSLEELHYYVESIRKDAERTVVISGQRATAYSINHIILTNESYEGYRMKNCSEFNYTQPGVESALVELILCGTLENTAYPADEIEEYMQNNTVGWWIEKINAVDEGDRYDVSVKIKNISLALYDPWHYVILTQWDIRVEDLSSENRYIGKDIPVTSAISITSLEDPLHYTHTGLPSALRLFTVCDIPHYVDGRVLDSWIQQRCYLAYNNSPSFFDRLEGRTKADKKFPLRSEKLLKEFGEEPGIIGLESMINLDLLKEYNLTVYGNFSQIDHMYWNNVSSRCIVDGMVEHPDFRIDIEHAKKHQIRGLNCLASVSQTSGADFFIPNNMTVPRQTRITWIDLVGIDHKLWALTDSQGAWSGSKKLPAGKSFSWVFNETGEYLIFCSINDHNSATFKLAVTSD
jgi:plastocyanin